MRADSYILRFIYSVGETLHDCISAYREFCGYDTSVPNPPHELEEALIALMRGYKDTKACCDVEIDGKIVGKAYHMQIEIPRGSSPPTHGYGAFIPLGANMHLALQLYKFYRLYPQEVWAKKEQLMLPNSSSILRKGKAINSPSFMTQEQNPFAPLPTG
jgi:hypothetical protein